MLPDKPSIRHLREAMAQPNSNPLAIEDAADELPGDGPEIFNLGQKHGQQCASKFLAIRNPEVQTNMQTFVHSDITLGLSAAGKIIVTSLLVAEHFGKRHDHVLRDIKNIINSVVYQDRLAKGGLPNFGESSYRNSQNKAQPMYEMDRQGFELLAMGFSGEDALRWRLKYSDAFAAMEKELLQRQLPQSEQVLLPSTVAKTTLGDMLDVARLLHVPEHLAQSEAVKMTKTQTGVDLYPMLTYAPAQNNIAELDIWLEPVDLGKQFGLSGAEVNKRLAKAGLQQKDNRQWAATEAGKKVSARHHWSSEHSTKSGYNLKWRLSAIRELLS